MVETTLRYEPSVVALPAAHPLAARERISFEAFAAEPMIALQRSLVPSAYDGQLAAIRERGFEPQIVQHARSPSEAVALVAAGVGVYRLPQSAATPHPGVVYREIDDAAMRLVLIHPPLLSGPARTIAALAVELFGDAPRVSNDSAPPLVTGARSL